MELTRRCEMTLEAAPPRFGQVRRIVQAQLRYWHLDPLIDPAVAGLTELLANVHEHAQPVKSCTVEMVHLAGCLTVSVRDADPRLPVAALPRLRAPAAQDGRAAGTQDAGGRDGRMPGSGVPGTGQRGMAVVAALCREWGAWNEEGGGKTVWFTLIDARHPAHRREGARRERGPARVAAAAVPG